jgi:hypothetical protein
MATRQMVPITAQHKALHAFEGKWKISQRFFMGPGAEPILSEGRAKCKVMLNGLATFMESELTNGYKAMVATTWNPTSCRYEGFFMDIFSFDGFDPLLGLPVTGFASNKGSRHNLGDKALFKDKVPVRERIWSSRLTVPRMTVLAEGTPALLGGVDTLGVQIVEHQVSDDEWALLCVATDAASVQFTQMENTYIRA